MRNSTSKRAKENQQYDEYWKLTVEYSDIHGTPFNNILNVLIQFIDEHNLQEEDCTEELNRALQERIARIYTKRDMASVRKSINQFIKLGFVKPKYKGYHPLAKRFLSIQDKTEKELLFTQIFYEWGSLKSSYKNDNTNAKEVNFLLKTLAYSGELSKSELIALMVTDVSRYQRGYMLPEELESQYEYAVSIRFDEKNTIRLGI